MATDEAEFGTELRGYRKEAVDRAIQDLRRDLIKANGDRQDAQKEVKRITAVAEDLQAEALELLRELWAETWGFLPRVRL